MVLEGEFIAETIIGGFVSKVVNNVWDVSWKEIKKADNSRVNKNQSLQTRIYQIIIDVLNLITHNQYKEKDIIYDTAERLLKEFKCSSNYNDVIQYGLKNLFSNINDSICQEFIELLCHELGEEKNFDLYKEILLLLVNDKSNYTNEELQQIQHKLDYVIQKLNDKSVDEQVIKIEEKKHQIQSRTQQYADKWNANMFLNDFSDWDENRGVNVKLKDVYIDEHLPHFIWGENKNDSYNLDVLLSKYIVEKSENKMLLILGQPGIGKSTLITWITQKFGKNFDDILVYQFASDLKNVDWQNSSIAKIMLDRIRKSNNDLYGKTLILDGFDEISAGDNRKEILDCFHRYFMNKMDFINFTIIITCRENYIRELKRLKCEYIILQPWDDKQIRSFCKEFAEKTKSNISIHTIEHILENKEILGIPLILYMVLALGIELDKESSIVDIYDKIFSLEGGIYDRCIDNKNFADTHRISKIKEQIHQVSREIAMWMFENNPDEASIPQEEYRKICESLVWKQMRINENVKNDFLIGNFFKLVRHCEGAETEELYFVHRTIYEYFVSETICTSIQETINISQEKIAGVLGNLLKGNILPIKILEFLKIKISNSKIDKQFDEINDAFQLMIQDGMTYHTNQCYKQVMACEMNLFTNMLLVLHLWEKGFIRFNDAICVYLKYNYNNSLNLSGVDLSGVNLSEVNLSRANLRSVNLSKANLSRANLSRADLSGANLKNAYLIEADLVEADLEFANLSEADLRSVNLNGADLIKANLSGADLKSANLTEADLIEADLSRADLKSANLTEADLTETDLRDTIINESQADYLKRKCDLHDVKVYLRRNKEIVNYEEYCRSKQPL